MPKEHWYREEADEEQLHSPSEIYHENSKLHASNKALYDVIRFVNTSPDARSIITRPFPHYRGYPSIPLPRDCSPTDLAFERIVETRRSEHGFSGASMPFRSLAKILYLGDGIVEERADSDGSLWKLRSAPSPGALYPIEVHLAVFNVDELKAGLYFYSPLHHQLEQRDERNVAGTIATATYLENESRSACACIVLSAVLPRIKFKYGQRAYRFALLEAGHIAQNILLTATASGLGAVPVGGFLDNAINDLFGFDGYEEIALYLILVGSLPQEPQSG